MKLLSKIGRCVWVAIWFVVLWIGLILLALPYDLVLDVLIRRVNVRVAFEVYAYHWRCNNDAFVDMWKSILSE